MKRGSVIRCAAPVALCGFALLFAVPAWSQSRVLQIEEHWELRIADPDSATSAPQITMVMSPNGHLESQYFLFTLNHETAPDYRPGGMQVQLWHGDTMVYHDDSHESGTLSYTDETIRWVQRISLNGNALKFEIDDGSSATWGRFQGDDVDITTSTSMSNLNGYLPRVSLTESQVGYSENRVSSLTLTKLRWLTDDGQVHEQNAPIPIDTSLDP